eukprot:TRINITY_DN2075_c1_g1_i4.p1 TRINITY_DN2075_c1_g1~~TRINITY_DN2075_c1_g1_i4.p1  ORF type:complete len:825 (+),score=170.29 TRINITY_DN2075_c1_g1_i4:307-2781(+)
MDDYPRVKHNKMEEIADIDFNLSDSEEEETGAASFSRKYARDNSVAGPKAPSTQEPSLKTSHSGGVVENIKRMHIAKEIYSTEKSYVEILGICFETYQTTLRAECSSFDETADTVNAIFGNMSILYGFNKKLLAEIEKIVQNWDDSSELGNTFVKLSPFLKMYTDYSNKYSEAIALFNRLEKKNMKFKATVDECYAAAGHQCRLTDMLITPIQRIPRYALLLNDLLKNTPPDHPDYENLEKSLKGIQDVATLVNESVRRRENTVRLAEMQTEGYDLSHFIVSTRHLIKDGPVKVKITRGSQEVKEGQYWILFNDTFVRCKKENVKHTDLRDHAVHLSLLWLGTKGKKDETVLTLPGETLTFADDAWETELRNAINNYVALSDTTPKLRKYVDETVNKENFRVGEHQDQSGYYIGQWINGQRNGKGKWEYRGNKYKGEWKADKPHGKGRWTYHTGAVHLGYFEEGVPHGTGMLKTVDGSKCICKFSRGKRKGEGKILYANGDVFQGTWKDDRIHGEGRLTCKNAVLYVGEWQNNCFHGVGKLSLPSGVSYEGNFVRGRKQGRGCIRYPDETVYVGDIEDGMRHGVGKMFKSEEEWYEGEWAFDFPEGSGRKLSGGHLYEGNFVRGFKHGYGAQTYTNEVGRYEGGWEFDKRHGEGAFEDLEGNQYVGTWCHDKLHGNATVTYTHGGKFEGIFRDGMREKGRYIGGKGDGFSSYEGEWNRGLMHGKGSLVVGGTTYKGSFENGTLIGDCTVSNTQGWVIHAVFFNDFKDGKITMNFNNSKGDEPLTGVLMSNTLMHNTDLIFNVEPTIPLLGRRLDCELSPTITHF